MTIFIFTIIPTISWAAAELKPSLSEDLMLDSDGYAMLGTCTVVSGECDNDEETLHIGTTGKCYIVDNDGDKYCTKHRVCILGVSEQREDSERIVNGCAGTRAGSDDEWKGYDKKIPDCKDYPKKTGKTPAFLTTDKKVLTDESGRIAKSAVFIENRWKSNTDFLSCVAYVCADADGKYVKQNKDGSCPDGTEEENKEENKENNKSEEKEETTTTQNEKKYRGTAQGYLDSLASYCGTLNSKK